jgi:hypothetical protein
MKPMRRFSEGGGSKLERLVASSVRDEEPSPRLRRQIERAVGLGVGVTAASANAHVGAKALGAAKTIRAAVSLALRKWVAVAAVAGATAGTGAYLHSVSGEGSGESPKGRAAATAAKVMPAVSTPAISEGAAASPRPPELAPIPPPLAAPVPAPPPPAEPTARARAAAASTVASHAPNGALPAGPEASFVATAPARSASLSDELHLLDEAHAALGAGDVSRAVAILDQHDRDFAAPMLAPEVLALRVEASVKRDDRTTEDLASRFLALYGDRPEAQHIRSILNARRSASPTP